MQSRKYLLFFLIIFFSNSAGAQSAADKTINASLSLAALQYKALNNIVPNDRFPRSIDSAGNLVLNKKEWWTSGFFPGSLWYLYEYSGDTTVKSMAVKRTSMLAAEAFSSKDHDIGFKIFCSFGNQLRITKDSSVVLIIIQAAKSLSKRYDARVNAIRSWGSIADSINFVVIIDNMMNLELLFQATRLTGDSSFYKIAVSHADKTLAEHYRPNGSSYHVIEYDQKTGKALKKSTAQGLADSSVWARGQAWGLYGYTMCYRETGQQKYLDHANRIAAFILTNPYLPADLIPYWDYDVKKDHRTVRDASAAAITASALLELSGYNNASANKKNRKAAEKIIWSLSAPLYRNAMNEQQNFLLKHSVGHFPARSEIDVPLSYADYYYLEAMMRMRNNSGRDHIRKRAVHR